MSALTIAVKTLMQSPEVMGIVQSDDATRARIYPARAPQSAAYPNIVIHLIHQAEEDLLLGASQWPVARISIECRASSSNGEPISEADRLAEKVVDWLRDKTRYVIDGCSVEFTKEGTDETDTSETSTRGIPDVARRIVDFYLRYRKL